MKGRLGDRQRLLHIIDAIAEVEQYTDGITLDGFLSNSMMRFASIKQIEIIGEASNQISEETKKLFTDLEWRKIIGMRNIILHEYFGVDFDIIWQLIISDLPDLKAKVKTVLENLP